MKHFDESYTLKAFQDMLAIDSTTGQFRAAQDWIVMETERLGYQPVTTHKGGVIVDLGGEGNPLVITAHLDDTCACIPATVKCIPARCAVYPILST